MTNGKTGTKTNQPPAPSIKDLDTIDKILAWMKDSVNKLINLEIKTEVVTDGAPCIHTVINLVDGDITTSIHKSFVPDKFNVSEFHNEQVKKSEEIIERNIKTVKEIGEWLMERIS